MAIERPITATEPVLSVVIPTIPRNDHTAVVDDLREQGFDEFEVIVVNDDDLDICEARNEGIRRAAADIVALTDDDCRPGSDWVGAVVEQFNSQPDLVCLEGAVTGGRTYTGNRRYVGCNLAFDREAALSIGGFRSDYAGWRDDTEFGWRMERDAEGECRYNDAVRMVHPERPRADIDTQKEELLKSDYPDRYEEIIVFNTVTGKINDWLWRNGVWNLINRIRDPINNL